MTKLATADSDVCIPRTRRRGIALIAVLPFLILGILALIMAGVYTLEIRPQRQHRGLIKNMKGFALDYHNFYGIAQRGPESLDEMKAFLESPDMGRRGFLAGSLVLQRIRDGRIVVVWSADWADVSDELDNYALAWESQTAEDRGLVVRGDGDVVEMTAEDFKAIPKIPARLPE